VTRLIPAKMLQPSCKNFSQGLTERTWKESCNKRHLHIILQDLLIQGNHENSRHDVNRVSALEMHRTQMRDRKDNQRKRMYTANKKRTRHNEPNDWNENMLSLAKRPHFADFSDKGDIDVRRQCEAGSVPDARRNAKHQ